MVDRKFLLDPGHEGMAFGLYLRQGKQSPQVPPGIYEGEFNRKVCALIESFDPGKYLSIAPGPVNIPLKDRIDFINELNEVEPCVSISIHANAADELGWSDARGFRVFHSSNASDTSKRLAKLTHESLEARLGRIIPPRSIKTENLSMVYKTDCPAIYVECAFMTNEKEARFMASAWGQTKIAMAIYSACEML